MPIAQVLMSVTGQTVGPGFGQIAATVEPLVPAGRDVLTQSPLSAVQFI